MSEKNAQSEQKISTETFAEDLEKAEAKIADLQKLNETQDIELQRKFSAIISMMSKCKILEEQNNELASQISTYKTNQKTAEQTLSSKDQTIQTLTESNAKYQLKQQKLIEIVTKVEQEIQRNEEDYNIKTKNLAEQVAKSGTRQQQQAPLVFPLVLPA